MRIGDPLEERLPGRTGTAGSPAPRAGITRAAGLRGEQIMARRPVPGPFGGVSSQVRSCWMCGIRLPVGQLVADGGDACPDVRWYCRDMWGCTKRWTSRSTRLTAVRPDVAEPAAPGEQPASPAAATPAPAMTVLEAGTGISAIPRVSPLRSQLRRSFTANGADGPHNSGAAAVTGWPLTSHPAVMA